MLNRRQQEIKQFLEERDIKEILHFTQVANLESILSHGLLSIEDLDRNRIDHYYNDENRFEKVHNAICLSISYPNYKMFYKYRKELEDFCKNRGIVEDLEWCVISLDPSILYEKDCLFCITNAASRFETNRSHYEKKGLDGLIQLFGDEQYRKYAGLPSYIPTDPQAEVLVLEEIETSYINAIHFDERSQEFNYFYYTYDPEKYGFSITPGLFMPRPDYKNWR